MSVVVVRDRGGKALHVVRKGDVDTGTFKWDDSLYYVRHSTAFRWSREPGFGAVTIEEEVAA